jgi:hypothetical protein
MPTMAVIGCNDESDFEIENAASLTLRSARAVLVPLRRPIIEDISPHEQLRSLL